MRFRILVRMVSKRPKTVAKRPTTRLFISYKTGHL